MTGCEAKICGLVGSDLKIVKNLRLGIFRGLSFLWVRLRFNSRFAIRTCTGSDVDGVARRGVSGPATARRQECLCHLRQACVLEAGAAADSDLCVVI